MRVCVWLTEEFGAETRRMTVTVRGPRVTAVRNRSTFDSSSVAVRTTQTNTKLRSRRQTARRPIFGNIFPISGNILGLYFA